MTKWTVLGLSLLATATFVPNAAAQRALPHDATISDMSDARNAALTNDRTRASAELRQAAGDVAKEAEKADPESREALRSSASDLERAAGSDLKAVEVDATIAKADIALARHHFEQVNDDRARSDRAAASEELHAAADHLERAAKASGRTMDDELAGTLRTTRREAAKLGVDGAWAGRLSDDVLRDLGRQIERVGSRVEAMRGNNRG